MRDWQKLATAMIFSLAAAVASAQEETPPNEPPYTNAEEEFEVPTERTQELQADDENSRGIDDLLESQTRSEEPAVVEERPAYSEPEPAAPVVRQEYDDEPSVIQRGERGSRRIRHPLAKEGLTLIDRDGSYHFQPKRSKTFDQTSVLRVGAIQPPPGIQSADGFTDYQTMYGSGNPVTLLYDYEWQPIQAFGRLGVQIGFGLFTAQGNGRFLSDGLPAREKYAFYALPITLGVVYRFQFTDRPWIAPYVSGGLMYFALAEMRDDGKSPNLVGTPTGYGGGGLMINLSEIDRETGFLLDSEYGIHGMWLTAEWRQIQASNEDLNFSGSIISFGVSVDY